MMPSWKSPLALSPQLLALLAVPVLLIGGLVGWVWRSASTETVIHDYLMAHPEVLPKAMEVLQNRETAKQLAGIRDGLEKPFPGAILGNPAGKVTLVEFTDFGCTYCRQSVADIAALTRANPDLRVVVREFPILSRQSVDAAKMGLAAAGQGKYPAFHAAMFAAGRPDALVIEAAAKAAGVDLVRARQAIADPRLDLELSRNMDLARQLNFTGTPSWVIGDDVISGAVGIEQLQKSVEDARS
jgi:protein-disulfide isomerase